MREAVALTARLSLLGSRARPPMRAAGCASGWASCWRRIARWRRSTSPKRAEAYFARARRCAPRGPSWRCSPPRWTGLRARAASSPAMDHLGESAKGAAARRRAARTRPRPATSTCPSRRLERGGAAAPQGLREYTDAERAAARRLLARLALRGPMRARGGRSATRRRRDVQDLRATLRVSLRHGGELLERRWRGRPSARAGSCSSRRLGLDGALRAHAAAVRAGVRRRARAGRGVRVRDAADARSRASSPAATPTARWSAPPTPWRTGRAARGSASRSASSTASTAAGSAAARSSSALRRLGPRRARGARRGDGAAAAQRAPDRLAQPARRRPALRAADARDAGRAAARRPAAAGQLDRVAGGAGRADGGGAGMTRPPRADRGRAPRSRDRPRRRRGRRFGGPKQLAELDGRPLLEHALAAMLAVAHWSPWSSCSAPAPSGSAAEVDLAARGVGRLRGLGRRAVGLAALRHCAALAEVDAVVVTLGDQPSSPRRRSPACSPRRPDAVRATYDGRPGPPGRARRRCSTPSASSRRPGCARAARATRRAWSAATCADPPTSTRRRTGGDRASEARADLRGGMRRIDEVWAALNDLERVAPCLPGAAITGHDEDGTYQGTFRSSSARRPRPTGARSRSRRSTRPPTPRRWAQAAPTSAARAARRPRSSTRSASRRRRDDRRRRHRLLDHRPARALRPRRA